ncbi:unnamed protein product [Rotaria sordida]|uniref:ADP-ribosylglycohydrolase n=1 Tax=Rotaria sordida TaxID=392033 RepID=A0A818SP25_9BILA|nr:unnamed protein product [Rotaria sordida]CAF1401014.1 unnamed protein product [Rotaria sordida]CAF3675483.1 unnamed protein product [Rotaria sordida]CAF3859452.1 unnamed protein product [Rotaria sordida]
MNFPSPHARVLPHQIPLGKPPESRGTEEAKQLNCIQGSLLGLAVGDALGASVEFRPHQYLVVHPVKKMQSGGTWGLKAGQWTDDTSMALCLASSLLTMKTFDPYNQMVRYKWWYKHGFLSATGHCFDIGSTTRQSLDLFCHRQKELMKVLSLRNENDVDKLSIIDVKSRQPTFDVNCSKPGKAGNGALMRLAPVPLFYFRNPPLAVEYSGASARVTHGDKKAVDACRYYGALIVAAIRGEPFENLTNKSFYTEHKDWFGSDDLHEEVLRIAAGSYQKNDGYDKGIRGKGYVIDALEAALWAFWKYKGSFKDGVLAAINLGDDTDTTAAIYGQLAGAYYGADNIPADWVDKLYAKELIRDIGSWLHYEGDSFMLENNQPKESSHQQVHSTDKHPNNHNASESMSTVMTSSQFPNSDSHNTTYPAYDPSIQQQAPKQSNTPLNISKHSNDPSLSNPSSTNSQNLHNNPKSNSDQIGKSEWG